MHFVVAPSSAGRRAVCLSASRPESRRAPHTAAAVARTDTECAMLRATTGTCARSLPRPRGTPHPMWPPFGERLHTTGPMRFGRRRLERTRLWTTSPPTVIPPMIVPRARPTCCGAATASRPCSPGVTTPLRARPNCGRARSRRGRSWPTCGRGRQLAVAPPVARRRTRATDHPPISTLPEALRCRGQGAPLRRADPRPDNRHAWARLTTDIGRENPHIPATTAMLGCGVVPSLPAARPAPSVAASPRSGARAQPRAFGCGTAWVSAGVPPTSSRRVRGRTV